LADYLVNTGETESRLALEGADLVISMIWYGLLTDPSLLTERYAEQISKLVNALPASSSEQTASLTIKEGYRTGLASALIQLHMDYYAPVWGFGQNFETSITKDFGSLLDNYNPQRDQLIRVENKAGQIVGTLVVEASPYPPDTARIRFFILAASAQGKGLGQAMLKQAIDTCRERGQTKLFLTTFKGLDAARTLYERAGFTLSAEYDEDDWGEGSEEVRYDLDLGK
jgi:GNAT superfamily N-acetyltransferase